MFNRLTGWALGASVSLAVTGSALGAELNVGDKAPKLDSVNWLQGEPVNEWAPGQVYVLDFWATWCGPCVASIPHMNEMHNALKDKGVNIIGVAIWPSEDMTPTDQFVKDLGDGMSYRIAEDIGEATSDAFMIAAGQNGIPTAMVIDGEGRVAWMGHPMAGLDQVVDSVREGSWDIEKAAAEHRASMEAEEKQMEAMMAAREQLGPLMARMNEGAMIGDWEAVLVSIDEVLGMEPALLEAAGLPRAQMMMTRARVMIDHDKMNDPAKGYPYLASVVDGEAKDDPYALNEIAWWIVDEPTLEKRDLDLAERAALRADTLVDHGDASILDTLGRVYFLKGDINKAIETQTKAIEIADDPELKAMLTETLNEYKAKAAQP